MPVDGLAGSSVCLVAVANVFNIGADLGSMAAAIRLLVPIPYTLLIVVVTISMLALEILIPYGRYPAVLRWLTVSLVAYVAMLFVVKVQWGEVLRAMVIPNLSWTKPQIAALIAILGTTISPYLFFWQASEEVEEQEGRNERRPARAEAPAAHAGRHPRGDGVGGDRETCGRSTAGPISVGTMLVTLALMTALPIVYLAL